MTVKPGLKRRFFHLLKLFLVAVLLLISLLAASGAAYQAFATARETRLYPPPGRLVAIAAGGETRNLHLLCTGNSPPGEITVILEGGAGEWSSFWGRVQPALSGARRVCAYDRAGYGWSDPVASPRTAQQIALELHALLDSGGLPAPYLLVAHSAGGLYARYFAHQYPSEVAGLVLVETPAEDLFIPLPEVFIGSLPVFRLCHKVLAPLGIVRLSGILPQVSELRKLPLDQQSPALARLNRSDFCRTAYEETLALQDSAEALRASGVELGDMPLGLIRAGQRAEDDWPAAGVWISAQEKLANLSTNARLWVAAQSGHYVQLDQPQVVVTAVEWVISQARPLGE